MKDANEMSKNIWHGFKWVIDYRQWKFELESGARVPRWYGVAYWDYRRNNIICYPIPFHVIVSVWRRVKDWFICGLGYYGTKDQIELERLKRANEAMENKLKYTESMVTSYYNHLSECDK